MVPSLQPVFFCLMLIKKLKEAFHFGITRTPRRRSANEIPPQTDLQTNPSGLDGAAIVQLESARTLLREGNLAEAAAAFRSILARDPDHVEALHALGVIQAQRQHLHEAATLIGRAIAIDPGNPAAHSNYANVMRLLTRNEEALACYKKVLDLNPNNAEALNNRGGLYREMGQHDKAAEDYARLCESSPGFEYALGNKLHSNLHACNWSRFLADKSTLSEAVCNGADACMPFDFLVMSDDPALQLKVARNHVSHKFPPAPKAIWPTVRYSHQRIRVAYLSADFYNHATAYLMAELFEKHDKSQFEVSAWSFGPARNDAYHARLRRAFERFTDVAHMSDFEVASMLRQGEIDIAIDLKGFTSGCRPAIFAHRAAPIQANYLGYPGTMGADYMDYIIGDATVIPDGHEVHYAEKVVRLPDSYQINDSKREISQRTLTRTQAGLPESGFVFCCFNSGFKITPDVFDIWMRLLNRIEGSVLWLLEENKAASRNLTLEAESRGVHAARLIFAPRVAFADHLARHRLADLFLDTFPCNAHTTASDALWAELPLLTCAGNSFASRVAASLLRAIGLPQLVTENSAAYEAMALQLAGSPATLNDLKFTLARNRLKYPLFNADRFRRHIESAYITMYQRHLRGDPPCSFTVQPTSIDAL